MRRRPFRGALAAIAALAVAAHILPAAPAQASPSARDGGAHPLQQGRAPSPSGPYNGPPSAGGARSSEVETGSGSGFFIDAVHVVTNQHVVDGCSRLASGDGAPLDLLAEDRLRDLALLRARTPASHWLPIAEADAGLGVNVFVLGYPFYETFSRDLTTTRGVLSAKTGLRGNRDNFTLSAPIQPGNSGGPVLDRRGAVIGVVVARISDAAVAEITDAIPQNINYAVTREALLRFLARERIEVGAAAEAAATPARSARPGVPLNGPPTAPANAGAAIDLDDGIPEALQAAVLPITCYAPRGK